MSADPNVLNLLVDLPVSIDLLGHVLIAIAGVGLVGTVELEDTEIVVIRARWHAGVEATGRDDL